MRRAGMQILVVGALALCVVPTAGAYSVRSGFSEGCHETITAAAFQDFILDLPVSTFPVPPTETWREVSHFAFDFAGVDPTGYDDAHRFLLVSLIIGVRAPDTEGFSILHLEHLRQLHSDPSDEGQYAHALRGLDDDYEEGDRAAVTGTRAAIQQLMELASAYSRLPAEEQIISGQVYLDFYGQIDVQVWAPFYYLGRAIHATQDTFSHTIRSQDQDYRRIVHVFNYLEAIAGELVERRDGLPHADSLDDCTRADLADIVQAAEDATVDLCYVFRADMTGADEGTLDHFFEKWMQLQPGCNLDNDFCGNTDTLAIAREAPTKPYVESVFGCRTAGHGAGTVPLLAMVLLWLGMRRLRRGRRP